jgi:DNA-binding CsgD family transcriptional regulator/tetratricopeptide (TPR) repeat protein
MPGPCNEARIRLVTSCANVEQLLGHRQLARARLLAALNELPEGSPQVATVKSELAVSAILATEFDQACVWAWEGHDAASRAGTDRPVRAVAAARAAIADVWIGRTDRAERALAEAVEIVDELTDSALARDPEVSFWLGSAEHFLDRLDDAIRHFERGISLSRATGQGQRILQLMLGLQLVLTERGRLAEAAELGTATREGARHSGSDQLLAFALWQGCSVFTGTGDLQPALRLGRQSFDMGKGKRHETIHAGGCTAFARALLESGRPDLCHDLLMEHLGGPGLPRLPARARCHAYEMLTAAELAQGRLAAAPEWVRRAEADASQLGLPLPMSAAHRSRALLLLALREAEAAADAALTAASEAAGAGASVEAARARLLAGCALGQAGNRPLALIELERAAVQLAECGAEGYRQRAARELRRLGRRMPPQGNGTKANGILGSLSGFSGLSGLSAREREIAEMVGIGQTNREIADHLYLSVKTVERHVSHIFTKLDVRSRAAVAGLVARHDRGSPTVEPANGSALPILTHPPDHRTHE